MVMVFYIGFVPCWNLEVVDGEDEDEVGLVVLLVEVDDFVAAAIEIGMVVVVDWDCD